jgi:hypothetical protein
MHGDVVIEEILDWSLFDYFTIGITLPVPDAPQIIMTRAVTPASAGGSILKMRVAQPKLEHKDFVDKAGAKFASNMTTSIEKFRVMVKDKQASAEFVEEPPLLPASG